MRVDAGAFVRAVLIGTASLAPVALLWRWPIVLTAVLAALSGLVLWHWRSRAALITFAACAGAGAAAEMVAVAAGAWAYAGAGGIPTWLPLLWGLAGLYAAAISRHAAASWPAARARTSRTPAPTESGP